MSSKPSESQELKVAHGWTAHSKTSLPPPTGPPRIAYSKTQLLDLYDPHATASIPRNMSEYPGLTSVEPLVPVNIAPDDQHAHVSAQVEPTEAPPQRSRFQPATSPVRPGVEAILGRDHPQPSLGLSSSAPGAEGGGGLPAAKKPGHVPASARDFWSGSAVLAAAERPNVGGTGIGTAGTSGTSERRPLHLKPRSSGTGDRAASPNGNPSEKSGQSQPYWSRGAPRGAADSKANWRGGNVSSSVASGGVTYPGSSNEELSSGLGAAMASSGTAGHGNSARKSTSDLAASGNFPHGSNASTGRSSFGRDVGPYGRNKEALKPTNTRDLSALAKGSGRDSTSSTSTGHHDREHREGRHYSSSNHISNAHSKPEAEGADDTQRIWYYRDPQGNTQGPFTGAQLIQWEKDGYYDAELPVSKSVDQGFKPLAIAFGMRKDDSVAPPPGFIPSSGPPKKEEKSLPPSSSMRPSREERNRRGMRTVEDMAEEVEMMRLQARNKRIAHEESGEKSEMLKTNTDRSVFDESHIPGQAANGSNDTNYAVKRPDDGESNGSGVNVEKNAEAKPIVSTTPDLSAASVNDVSKSDSPVKQSRFAALMRQDLSKPAITSPEHEDKTNLSMNRVGINNIPSTSRDVSEASTSVNIDARPDERAIPQSDTTSLSVSRGDSSAPWTSMMLDLQQKQVLQQKIHENQHQPTSSALNTMPSTSSDQDLMAIDPAITHASFARPSVPSSPPLSSPRAPGDLPPWLQNSVGIDTNNNSSMREGMLMSTQTIPTQSPHQTPHMAHLSSHDQAQLHARAQARARAEAHAHAEAMRRAQIQAQIQAQAQAVHLRAQAQAQEAQARVAAQQRASALAQAQAHAQDPIWLTRHHLGQLQGQYDLALRSYHEMTRTAQAAQNAINSGSAGTHGTQRARSLLAQATNAMKEHRIQMERIQGLAQTHQSHLLQLQAAASREQHQRQMPVHAAHVSPSGPGTTSSQTDEVSSAPSPTPYGGSRSLSVPAGSKSMQNEPSKISTVEEDSVGLQEQVDEDQEQTRRNLASAYEEMAVNDEPAWEKVSRRPKHVPHAHEEAETSSVSYGIASQSGATGSVEDSTGFVNEQAGDLGVSSGNGMSKTTLADFIEEGVAEYPAVDSNSSRDGHADSTQHNHSHHESVPTVAPWSKAVAPPLTNNGLSLREIQRQEELRGKAEEESSLGAEEQLREETPKATAPRWGSGQPWGGAGEPVKQQTPSLREIEEEQKKKKISLIPQESPTVRQSSGVGTSAGPLGTKTGWASLVAKGGNNAQQRRGASTVTGERADEDTSFWESVNTQVPPRTGTSVRSSKPAAARPSQGVSSARSSNVAPIRPGPSCNHVSTGDLGRESAPQTAKTAKDNSEGGPSDDNTIIGGRISNEFAIWCKENLQKLTGNNSDDTTMFEYLVMLGSSSEIRDTILQNIGSNDKTRSFADEFIRRLEFERMSVGTGGVGGKKKGRRHRAAKVDPSLVLGFTSTSSRIMQGTIETPEMK